MLRRVPAWPGRTLAISQLGIGQLDPTLTHGHPARQVSRWDAELQRAPVISSPVSSIRLPVGLWPAFGGQLADAHFNLALATADWAVRIPPWSATGQPCVPLDQAREAIAIWLAILVTGWARWINAHTTDAQLATALGIRMPSVAVLPMPTTPLPGASTNPVCTA